MGCSHRIDDSATMMEKAEAVLGKGRRRKGVYVRGICGTDYVD